MIVKPFNAKRLNEIFSIYTVSDLTKPKGVCTKIPNKISRIYEPRCCSTRSDQIVKNTVVFYDVVPMKPFIESNNIILTVRDAAKFYRDYLINDRCSSLPLFSGTIKIGINPRWEVEMTTLGGPCETTLEYTEKNITCLSGTEIANLKNIVRLIIDDFVDKNCDECAYYTHLFYALSFEENNRRNRMICMPPELSSGLSSKEFFNELSAFMDRINNKVSSYNMGVPMIERVVYNAPNTVVFWKDGTSTTVTATEGEEFNKEIGLAMAISRKYFAVREDNPRAAFKNVVKNADDYTAASEHKRQQKERKIQKKLESENGHNTGI